MSAIDKTPETIGLMTYVWVVGLSSLGGFVAFSRKVKQGHARAWNIAEFIGEIATSALAGLITFFFASGSHLDPWWTAALVAISGHMGSRAIFMFEKWAESRFPPVEQQEQEK